MKKSLYSKLVLIMLTIIISLMTVVGAFLMRGVRTFYQQQFYEQMRAVFSTTEVASDLRDAADSADPASQMAERLKAYTGRLGIDSGTRNFYILTGDTGEYITGSSTPENGIAITPNITTAISGSEGYISNGNAGYMDVALPISGSSGNYIVYIIDNKTNVQELGQSLFTIILEALAVGLVLSVGLSMSIIGRDDGTAVLDIPTVVMRFLSILKDSGYVCSEIRDISHCYKMDVAATGDGTLTPLWHFSTDIGDFYINGVTGKQETVTQNN